MVFSDEQRRIFGPYFNGAQNLYADPLRVYRRLCYRLEGDPNKFIRERNSPDAQASLPARDRLLEATAFAFDMVPFDPATGKGALTQDVEKVLRDYLEYMEKKGRRESKPPTSPLNTAQARSSVPAPLPTPNSSRSISTSLDCGSRPSTA